MALSPSIIGRYVVFVQLSTCNYYLYGCCTTLLLKINIKYTSGQYTCMASMCRWSTLAMSREKHVSRRYQVCIRFVTGICQAGVNSSTLALARVDNFLTKFNPSALNLYSGSPRRHWKWPQGVQQTVDARFRRDVGRTFPITICFSVLRARRKGKTVNTCSSFPIINKRGMQSTYRDPLGKSEKLEKAIRVVPAANCAPGHWFRLPVLVTDLV